MSQSTQSASKSGCNGCLTAILGGGIVTIGIIGACMLVCLAAGVLIAIGIGQKQNDALDANGGFGEADNPIPAGTPLFFGDFSIIPLQIIRPANDRISQRPANEPPAAGTDYVMVYFRVTCQKRGSELCRGYEPRIWLVDSEGNEWGEPTILIFDDNLDPKEVISGSRMEGWQVFEFPKTESIVSIKIMEPFGATLYTRPPAQ